MREKTAHVWWFEPGLPKIRTSYANQERCEEMSFQSPKLIQNSLQNVLRELATIVLFVWTNFR